MINVIFVAILKELFRQYPGISWLAILDQIGNLGPGAREEFERWWMTEMDLPFPGMEPQENTGPVYDPGKA